MSFDDIPLASGKRHVKAFEQFGWILRRDANHLVMTHPAHHRVHLSIPNHKEVRRGTLQKLIRAAGLSEKQYREMFDSL